MPNCEQGSSFRSRQRALSAPRSGVPSGSVGVCRFLSRVGEVVSLSNAPAELISEASCDRQAEKHRRNSSYSAHTPLALLTGRPCSESEERG